MKMDKPIDQYWRIRLADVKQMLESNNFEVYLAENAAEAKKMVLEDIAPKTGAKSIAWGGSMTFIATGLYDALKKIKGMTVFDTFDRTISREESIERRRQSLLVDLFITGTNAVTETGMLVNLDMIGNRVAALTFGPKNVIILVGRNKIVPDLEEAMIRVKNFVAPANVMRLGMKTPCAKTSYCEECRSKERICNSWTITEKSFPKGRIKVILINEDLGI
jgi:L-lactate utilization protein LutB